MTTPSFVDLNEVLPRVVATGAREDVQRLVASNLTTNSIVEVMKKTRRYELLDLFLPLLNLDCSRELCETFDILFAEALAEGNAEGLAQLRRHLKPYLDHRNIAFHYGQIATSTQLPVACDRDYTQMVEFQEGLVSVNNVDLIPLREQHYSRERLHIAASEYCAKGSMDCFGYDTDKLKGYIRGAIFMQNFATFQHLLETVRDRERYLTRVKKVVLREIRFQSRETIQFVSRLLKEGYLSFTEEEWAMMQKDLPLLYAGLQAGV